MNTSNNNRTQSVHRNVSNASNPSPSWRDVASVASAPSAATATPIFSQGDSAAIAAVNLPAGRESKSKLPDGIMSRKELKRGPRIRMNLSVARLDGQPVIGDGFTLVTSNKRKASSTVPPPIPSFSQALPAATPETERVTSTVRRTATTSGTVTEKKTKFFKITDRKKQASDLIANSHFDLTQSFDEADVASHKSEDVTASDVADDVPRSDIANDTDDFIEEKKENDESPTARATRESIEVISDVINADQAPPKDDPNRYKTAIDQLRLQHARPDGSLPTTEELKDCPELSISEKTLLCTVHKAAESQRKPAPVHCAMLPTLANAADSAANTLAARHASRASKNDVSPVPGSNARSPTMAAGSTPASAVDLVSPILANKRARRVSGGSGMAGIAAQIAMQPRRTRNRSNRTAESEYNYVSHRFTKCLAQWKSITGEDLAQTA